MDYSVTSKITPKAAARLLISGEIELPNALSPNVAEKVFDALLNLPIDDFLKIVDTNAYGSLAESKDIPQFGNIDTLVNVPSYFLSSGTSCADYPQLGFFLKQDVYSNLNANTKFGENHGKAMATLGMINCINKRFYPNAFSIPFCNLDTTQKISLVNRLFFRIPIIQILLLSAKSGRTNGYAPMCELKLSTKRRRSQCLRAIFKSLRSMNNPELSARIDNITWDEE